MFNRRAGKGGKASEPAKGMTERRANTQPRPILTEGACWTRMCSAVQQIESSSGGVLGGDLEKTEIKRKCYCYCYVYNALTWLWGWLSRSVQLQTVDQAGADPSTVFYMKKM